MLTLVGIYVCTVFSIMQSSGVSMVLPMAAAEFDLAAGINIAAGEIGPATSLYSLAASLAGPVGLVLMPIWGYLAARSPHLRIPLLAFSVLMGAVALLTRALATNIFIVIATGALYGFVSAGVFVIGFMLIKDMFPAQKIGIYMGLIGTMMAIGSLASPVITGMVIAFFDWRAACHMLWPFFLVGALLFFFGANIKKEDGKELVFVSGKIDLAGIVAATIFLATLICGISFGSTFIPFGTMQSFACFGVSLVSLVVLIFIVMKKGAGAVIPLPALKNRNTVSFSLANFIMNFANMFVFFFLPAYIMNVMQPTDFGLDPAAWAGLVMACFAVFGLFLGPIFGNMISKSGSARTVLLLGAVARLLFLVCMIFFLTPGFSIFILMGLALVLGGVYSVMTTAFTTGVAIMTPDTIRQQSNAVVQMGQNLGGALGIAVGGIIVASFGFVAGMPIAFVVAAIAVIIMFVPIALLKKRQQG